MQMMFFKIKFMIIKYIVFILLSVVAGISIIPEQFNFSTTKASPTGARFFYQIEEKESISNHSAAVETIGNLFDINYNHNYNNNNSYALVQFEDFNKNSDQNFQNTADTRTYKLTLSVLNSTSNLPETRSNSVYLIFDLYPTQSEWFSPKYRETVYRKYVASSSPPDSNASFAREYPEESAVFTHSHYKSSHLTHESFTKDGENLKFAFDCFYEGSIRGIPKSWLILDNCLNRNSFTGYIYDGSDQYYLEPNEFSNGSSSLHKIWPIHNAHTHYETIFEEDRVGEENSIRATTKKLCGIPNFFDSIPNQISEPLQTAKSYKIRKKRDLILPENQGASPLVIELYVVNDYAQFVKWKKDERKVILRTLQISHILNAIFKQLNILVALVGTEVWTSGDRIKMSPDGDTTLKNFNKYRQTSILRAVPHDNAQLLTANYFDGGVIGKAIKRQICAYSDSTGVAMDHNALIGPVASTMAHELGHSLGMDHDTEICDCPEKVCVMTPASGIYLATKWSSCSLQYLSYSIARGMDTCLHNVPSKVLDTPKCGNLFLEPGEECDCGLPQYCQNKCCNATTCRFTVNSTCATGSCCNFFNCQPRSRASICRPAVGPCDLPEYCDGRSQFCPSDLKVQDGTPCPTRSTYAKIYGGDGGADIGLFNIKKYIVSDKFSKNVQTNSKFKSPGDSGQDTMYFNPHKVAASSPALAYPKDQRFEFWPDEIVAVNNDDTLESGGGVSDYLDGVIRHAARKPSTTANNTNNLSRSGNAALKARQESKDANIYNIPNPDHQPPILGANDENPGKFKMVFSKGHCFSGFCNSYTAQCRLLWGPTSKMAVPTCFKQNVFDSRLPHSNVEDGGGGDSNRRRNYIHHTGDCGYHIQSDTYTSCPKDDFMCGRLHCVTKSDKLIYGETSGRKEWHSYVRYNNLESNAMKRSLRYWSCHSAFIDLGAQVPDMGIVPDGASCDIDKMCVNKSCVHKSKLNIKKCPKNCNGKGICNSKNHCHCFFGYSAPFCDKPGPGGSIDSGPPANIRRIKPLIKAMLMVFLCFVPLLCIFSFCVYKCVFRPAPSPKSGNGAPKEASIHAFNPGYFVSKFFDDVLYAFRHRFSPYKSQSPDQTGLDFRGGKSALSFSSSSTRRGGSVKKKYSATNYTTAILNPLAAGDQETRSHQLTALSIQHSNNLLPLSSKSDKFSDWPLSDREILGPPPPTQKNTKRLRQPGGDTDHQMVPRQRAKSPTKLTKRFVGIKPNKTMDTDVHQPSRPAPPPPNTTNTSGDFKHSKFLTKVDQLQISSYNDHNNNNIIHQKDRLKYVPHQTDVVSSSTNNTNPDQVQIKDNNGRRPSKKAAPVKRIDSLNRSLASRPMVQPPKPPPFQQPPTFDNETSKLTVTLSSPSMAYMAPPTRLLQPTNLSTYQNVKHFDRLSSSQNNNKGPENNALPLPPRKNVSGPSQLTTNNLSNFRGGDVDNVNISTTVNQLTKIFENNAS